MPHEAWNFYPFSFAIGGIFAICILAIVDMVVFSLGGSLAMSFSLEFLHILALFFGLVFMVGHFTFLPWSAMSLPFGIGVAATHSFLVHRDVSLTTSLLFFFILSAVFIHIINVLDKRYKKKGLLERNKGDDV